MDNRPENHSRGILSNKSKLKSSSSIGSSFFSTKLCSSCVQPLGLFISRGSCCPKCELKVCKKCKIHEGPSTWTCLACYKIMKHGRGGITTSNLGDGSRTSGIKRSFSITETSKSSPVLKSYTKYYEDRPYNSLPRMASNFQNVGGDLREGGGHRNYNSRGNIIERKSSLFQSTLHPFHDNVHGKKSPTSSVNFIEDEYWDYYDYEFNCNRSSCERSLGDTVEYQHCVNDPPPRKPERRKCKSMGAFDAKYSQLKTYCVITKDTGKNRGSYNSLPRKQKKATRDDFEKENNNSSNAFIAGVSKMYENSQCRIPPKNNMDENAAFRKEFQDHNNSSNWNMKNRSIVTLKEDTPKIPIETESLQVTATQNQKANQNGKDWNSKQRSSKSQSKSSNPNSFTIQMESTNEKMRDHLPYKNYSIHSSLRKNKYLDFYNGFTNNKSGSSGLYFSLPPMKDRESPPTTTTATAKSNGIEREIPIQFGNTNLPLHPKNLLVNKSAISNVKVNTNSFENPYYIVEQLKKKSDELTKSKYASHTLPKSKPKEAATSITSTFATPAVGAPNSLAVDKRGTRKPLFMTTPNILQPTALYNNNRESILFSADKDKNNRISASVNANGTISNTNITRPNSNGVREVIIVIERECDSPKSPNALIHTSVNGTSANQNPSHKPQSHNRNNRNDSQLTESTSTQFDPIIVVTPTPIDTATSESEWKPCKKLTGDEVILNQNSNKKMETEVEEEISAIAISNCSSSSSSSSSSFLSNTKLEVELDREEDFGPYSLLFYDCFFENGNDLGVDVEFKSCEEGDDEELKDCGDGGSGIWLGGNNQQVRGMQLQFSPSPGSEASSTSTTSTSTTVKGAKSNTETESEITTMTTPTTGDSSNSNNSSNIIAKSLLLLSQPENVNENENMVTAGTAEEQSKSSTVILPIPIINVGEQHHQIHHKYHQQDMNSSRSTTNKKFKSRILVNADCDYDSDGVVTNVEITGDCGNQVGIVTGRGTFIRQSDLPIRDSALLENVSSRFRGTESICFGNINEDEKHNKLSQGKYFIGAETSHNENGSQRSGETKYNEKETFNTTILSSEKIQQSKTIEKRIENLTYDNKPDDITEFRMSSSKIQQSLPFSCRRESPEGEESAIVKTKFDASNDDILLAAPPIRSSPDGADKSDETSPIPNSNPIIEEPMENEEDDDGESTDSWTEEAVFEDDEKPPPLDLTLHTIVEESCESCDESETEPDTPKANKLNELEKYYNFTTEEPVHYEESEFSEFSDTFSESSLSFELRNSLDGDHYELETGRLEKYFLNLGLSNDSDSVGSESDSECSVLDNRKKVLRHHRRSAEFEESKDLVSEDDECAFEQDGLDTIKKQRKMRRSSEDLDQVQIPNLSLDIEENLELPSKSQISECSASRVKETTPATVSRSNSCSSSKWSSDEEVNLMMSKLKNLIKNMVHIKKVDEQKNDKLTYMENELVRLMKNENIKNIVESISSDSDEDVFKLFERVESNQPEILSKVMTHIGKRLSTWMKDTDEFGDDGATIKCAPSVSSDLNEDRFSWKGSFESTLAKRQSVGSSDSIDGGGAGVQEGNELFSERSILRSSSLHHLATSQPILEESEPLANSLPRLNDHPITSRRTKNALINHQEVKSGRYRPPGYFENMETHVSTPTLNTFAANKLHDGFHTSRKNFNIRGQIEFLMQYNYKCSTFEICIKQCRDLAAVDTKRGRSDPYVKVYLLPERAKSSKKKTKVKKNTLNPMFGEVLKFPVTLEELENRILWLTVWHSGLFGKNEFLGEVLLNLRNITFDDVNYKWFPLQEQSPLDNFAPENSQTKQNLVLSLALKWSPRTFNRGNLSILIKEAKGLKYIKNSCPSTFVKCSPINEKSQKKQKTPLCRKTLTPVWNTTLIFENITIEGLELALYNYDLLNHELISSVKLDPDCDIWREMEKREGFWVEGLVQLLMT